MNRTDGCYVEIIKLWVNLYLRLIGTGLNGTVPVQPQQPRSQ